MSGVHLLELVIWHDKGKMENARCSFVRTCYLTFGKGKREISDVHLLELAT